MISSCYHSDTPEPEPDPVVVGKKTLLMYWPYTGANTNLYTFFLANIKGIETSIKLQGGLGDNHLAYFISTSDSTSYLINVGYKNNKVCHDTIRTYLNPELTTKQFISTVLNDVKSELPAEKYAMDIGCHGEGWLPAFKSSTQQKSRFWGSGAREYQTDLTTLADAITACDLHMQYILFDVCYMSCIENVYTLKDVTDYIIASTSEVMNYGMPYQDIFPTLMQDEPDYEAINNKFLSFYSNYTDPYGTLGITRTEYADQMAELMKQINASYSITDEQLAQVQDLDVEHRNPTIYYDFGDYVTKMLTDDTGDDTKALMLQQFNDLLTKLVPYKSCTEYIMSYIDKTIYLLPVTSFSGLTISDPSTHPDAITTKTQTSWWKATH